MPKEVTEVLYNQSQAERELKKLDRNVKRSGKTAKKVFREADLEIRKLRESIKKTSKEKGFGAQFGKFQGQLKEINPQLTGVVGKIGKLAGGSGALAAGFTAAGAAILATVANVVNLSGKLADIDKRIQVINETAERTLRFRDLAAAIGDENENRRELEAKRQLDLLEAQQAFRENEVQEAKRAADELVSVRKAALAKVDAAFKKSISERQTAEERLQDKLKELSGEGNEFSNQPKGRQIGSLAAKAAQEARKGNVDVAEELITKAKQLSSELGDHVFFTNQIDRAQSAVVRALEKDVKTAKTKEGQLANEKKKLEERVTAAEKFQKALQKELDTITAQNRALTAQRKIIENSAQLRQDVQKQEQGQRRVQTGVDQIIGIAGAIGDQSGLGRFRDQLKDTFTAVFSEFGTKLGSINDGRRSVDAIVNDLANQLGKAFADGEITGREAETLANEFGDISEAAGVLEAALADGSLTGALKEEVERVVALFRGITNIGEGGRQFVRGGGGFDTGITADTTSQNRRELERVIEKREVNQEIVVNIEGGMIDQATIEQITEIVRREVRKETQRE